MLLKIFTFCWVLIRRQWSGYIKYWQSWVYIQCPSKIFKYLQLFGRKPNIFLPGYVPKSTVTLVYTIKSSDKSLLKMSIAQHSLKIFSIYRSFTIWLRLWFFKLIFLKREYLYIILAIYYKLFCIIEWSCQTWVLTREVPLFLCQTIEFITSVFDHYLLVELFPLYDFLIEICFLETCYTNQLNSNINCYIFLLWYYTNFYFCHFQICSRF